MIEIVRQSLISQFEAALCMFNDCVTKCPDNAWEGKVAKYPFWHVAYHTLCFVDLYLSPDEATFPFRPDLHPTGANEYEAEYPSRRFDRPEIDRYIAICRDKAITVLSAETPDSLAAPSGFEGRPPTRLELHFYNLRHLTHHTGQLGAYLRRTNPTLNPRWIGTGWR